MISLNLNSNHTCWAMGKSGVGTKDRNQLTGCGFQPTTICHSVHVSTGSFPGHPRPVYLGASREHFLRDLSLSPPLVTPLLHRHLYRLYSGCGINCPHPGGLLLPKSYVDVPAEPQKSDFLCTNFLPNCPPISKPFSIDNHPILLKLGAFYNNLLKIHPIFEFELFHFG